MPEDLAPALLEWSGSSTLCSIPKSTASTEYAIHASVRRGVHLPTGYQPPCCSSHTPSRHTSHGFPPSLTSCVFPTIPTASQPPQIALRPSTDSRSDHDSATVSLSLMGAQRPRIRRIRRRAVVGASRPRPAQVPWLDLRQYGMVETSSKHRREKFWNLIGRGTLLSTHELRDVSGTSARVIRM